MKDLNEADPRIKKIVSSATGFAVEIAKQVEKKFGGMPAGDAEAFVAAFLSVMASSTYGMTFRDHGEKAADKWLEFFLSGLSEAIQGLGLRRCFAFARDPIVLDPRSSPSGPSSPRS